MLKQIFTKPQYLSPFQTENIRFANNIFNVAKMAQLFFDTVENSLGKGENAGYQHFLFFS